MSNEKKLDPETVKLIREKLMAVNELAMKMAMMYNEAFNLFSGDEEACAEFVAVTAATVSVNAGLDPNRIMHHLDKDFRDIEELNDGDVVSVH